MNELKNVLKRLQDEEIKLSSEKVELGSIDELKADISRMKKGINDLKELRKQMRVEYFIDLTERVR